MNKLKNSQQFPVFGKSYDLDNPADQAMAIRHAENEAAQARRWFDQSRSYLLQCERLVNELKAQIYYRKGAGHE
jgi:hypothetical protein